VTQENVFAVESLSRGAQRALYNLITILGDNKFRLGVRYAEYCNSAPTLEAGIAAAAMAQDELGHTRNLFPLLREFSWAKSEVEDGIMRANYRSLSFLDRAFTNWSDFVVATFLLDQAITTILESARESAFIALRQRARKMVVEERFHSLYGDSWFVSLSDSGPAARAELESQMRVCWDEVLCFFGPAGAAGLKILKDEGVLEADSEDLRARFLKRIASTMAEAQMDLNGHLLPWERWDMQTWRLKPAE
jgi:phenylacetate-CoA oxygenase PaaI subunit